MSKLSIRNSSVFLITAIVAVSGFFVVDATLAYGKDGISLGQFLTKNMPYNISIDLNKTSLSSKEGKSISPDSSTINKGNTGSTKSQQISAPQKYVEGEILIKYKNTRIDLNTSSGRTVALNFTKSKSLENKENISTANISVLKIKDNKTVEEKIAELKNDPNVEYAEPNYGRYPSIIDTNDTNKGVLWALDNTGQSVNGVSGTSDADIDAPESWAISEGANSSIVAIIDSGVAYNHPDLIANMWNGINCKDETGVSIIGGCNHGYDYEDGDNTPLPTTSYHGTHVAGIIAAEKNNNKGIIGVAPKAKIMAIKFGDDIVSEVKAIDFAIQNGAKVINASFGGVGFSQTEYDAINRFKTAGGIFVTAAGNESANNESIHSYPSDYNLDNIISVTATDQNDTLASFSNYGATSVDVGAPGVNIYSAVDNANAYTENFEGGTYNVLVGGDTTSHWIVDHDGNSMAAYSDKNVPYEPSAHTWLLSKNAIDLVSGGIKGATMNFTIWCDTPPAPINWQDYILTTYYSNGIWYNSARYDEDQIRADGGYSWTDSGHVGYYKNYTEDISSILSSDFRFSFDWITDSSIDSNLGCTVDDIRITKYSDGSDEKYSYEDGTSMATPQVAGLAALIEGYNPNLTVSQVKNIILTTGDSKASLSGKTVSGKRINAEKALQAANPAKAVTVFNFNALTPAVTGVVNEENHTIALTVPFGTPVTALVPTITITGASITPASGAVQDFTSPVTYTVTAADSSTQAYVATVTVAADSDIAAVAADKAALVEGSIKGENLNLSNITIALTDPLPTLGANGSTIAWASDTPVVISNDGQTINRPAFADGDAIVTLTATITKGVVTDTKVFTLTVLKLPASTVAIITSATYTVSAGGTGSETITNVPFGTLKATFLAALSKVELNQTWNDTGIADPVVTGGTLVVMAQDGVTKVVYVITVNVAPDTTAPVITLLGDNTVNLYVGDSYTDAGATASDDVDGDITADIVVAGDIVDTATIGTYIITYNVSDVAGNPATEVTRTINVSAVPDTTSPIITLLGDNTVNLYVGDSYIDAGATASDNVDGDITANIVVVNPVNINAVGTYVVTYNVSDVAGNPATEVTRTINVSAVPDTTAPVIDFHSDIIVVNDPGQAGAIVDYTLPIATDNIDDSVTVICNLLSGIFFPIGDTNITCDATDVAGNHAIQTSFKITVTDAEVPVITLLGDNTVNLYVGDSYTDAGATASDNVDGDITSQIVTAGTVDTATLGTYTITYNVSDTAGNPATEVTRTVNVIAVPVTLQSIAITHPANKLSYFVGESLDITGLEVTGTYSDASTQIETITEANVTGFNSSTSVVGQVLTITVNGKVATYMIDVVDVPDTTAPVITLIGDNPMTIEVGSVFADPGVTASDNVDGDITSQIVTAGTVDTATLGTYTITYNVSDAAGNSATEMTRTVNVADTTDPVITLLGDNPVNLYIGDSYTDAGATASDNVDGDITANIVTTGLPISTDVPGTFLVVYNVSDAAGNEAELARTVNVVDISTPIISLLGDNPTTIEVGSEYTDAGATASDDVDGDITSNIIVINSVDPNVLGTYTVTYNITDSSGNPAPEAVRTVNVVDTTKPVITLIGDNPAQVEVGYEYHDAGATASDNYDGDITADIVSTSSVDYHTVGTYSVIYNVTDSSGNSAEPLSREVVVGPDLTPPVITLNGGDVSIQIGTTYTDSGATASDNADGDITSQIVTAGTVDTATLGTYTITYNVSDAAGNSATEVTRTVNVVAAPVTFTLTYTAGANGSITGDSPQTVNSGSDGTSVTAVPASGYHFVKWSDDSTANPRTDTNVTENISITANFEANPTGGGGGGGGGSSVTTYTITASAGTNGLISPAGPTSVIAGNSQTYTITPNAGYKVADVLVDNVSKGSITTYTFSNVTGSHTISATFAVGTQGAKDGDANGDGKVDKYDFALMMANWGKTGTNTCDFNSDGKVDKYDFALLMSKWGL